MEQQEITCSFCTKKPEQTGLIFRANKEGVYICDECAIFIVFGPVMSNGGDGIDFILPNGEIKRINSFGEQYLGAEFCPSCNTYNVELGVPVKDNCIRCGSIFPIRKIVKFDELGL